MENLAFGLGGVTITVRRSKADQEGAGMKKDISFGRNAEMCPVEVLRKWLMALGITEGAIFRPVNWHV